MPAQASERIGVPDVAEGRDELGGALRRRASQPAGITPAGTSRARPHHQRC